MMSTRGGSNRNIDEPGPERSISPKGARTAEQIVDAAVQLFSRRGFEGTSVAAIGERAGLTDAGVLYHFGTKMCLFDAVVQRFAGLQAETFRSMVAPGGLAAIKNLAGWGAVMEAHPDLLSLQIVLNAEAIAPDAELHGYWASRHSALLGLLAEIFRVGMRRKEIRSDIDPDYEAHALTAHLDGARLQWFYSDGEISIATSFETYVGQLVDRIAIQRH
jgi:AcrR family transcriptional regulator